MSEADIRHRRNPTETPVRRKNDAKEVDASSATKSGKKGGSSGGRSNNNKSGRRLLLGMTYVFFPILLTFWLHARHSLHSNQQAEMDDIALSSPNSTLALLFPPGLMGGYRNQVLRFAALAHYALQHNLTLFLPSLWWSTQVHALDETGKNGSKLQWYPVPMELLFDIEGWNAYAVTHDESIPRIVTKIAQSDCWSSPIPESSNHTINRRFLNLYRQLQVRGSLSPLENLTNVVLTQHPTQGEYNPRQADLLPNVVHCHHPRVYGGGQRAGRLWNDYLSLMKQDPQPPVLAHVLQALQPLPHWRNVGTQHCLSIGGNEPPASSSSSSSSSSSYVALHARVELEMLVHPCGSQMERNLSRILSRVGDFLDQRQSEPRSRRPTTTLFVAVSREGIADSRFPQLRDLAAHNLRTLNEYAGDPAAQKYTGSKKLLHERYPVVECGGEMMKRYAAAATVRDESQQDTGGDLGTLLEQVINFDLAVQANVFIGVDGSSYSNAVWTTRYYLGKGQGNYRYTASGLEAVEGLPKPHGNCRRQRKPPNPKN